MAPWAWTVKLAKTLAPTAWNISQPMLDPTSPHILLQLLPAFARLTLLMETVHGEQHNPAGRESFRWSVLCGPFGG
jgi:hypothetical protein